MVSPVCSSSHIPRSCSPLPFPLLRFCLSTVYSQPKSQWHPWNIHQIILSVGFELSNVFLISLSKAHWAVKCLPGIAQFYSPPIPLDPASFISHLFSPQVPCPNHTSLLQNLTHPKIAIATGPYHLLLPSYLHGLLLPLHGVFFKCYHINEVFPDWIPFLKLHIPLDQTIVFHITLHSVLSPKT